MSDRSLPELRPSLRAFRMGPLQGRPHPRPSHPYRGQGNRTTYSWARPGRRVKSACWRINTRGAIELQEDQYYPLKQPRVPSFAVWRFTVPNLTTGSYWRGFTTLAGSARSVGFFYILLGKDKSLHFKLRISKEIFFWHKTCFRLLIELRLSHYEEGSRLWRFRMNKETTVQHTSSAAYA